MASCESHRSCAYSEDLRWHIVWQKYALSLTMSKIAENLSIDDSTVKRILTIFSNTGTLTESAVCKFLAKNGFKRHIVYNCCQKR